MAAVLTLRSTYHPDPPGHGTVDAASGERGADPIGRFRLALTSTSGSTRGPDSARATGATACPATTSSTPAAGFVLAPGERAGDRRAGRRAHRPSRQRRPGERVRGARRRLDDRRPRRADGQRRLANEPSHRSAKRTSTLPENVEASCRWCRGRASIDRPAGTSRAGAGAIAARLRPGRRGRRRLARQWPAAERRLDPDGPWALGVGDDTGAGAGRCGRARRRWHRATTGSSTTATRWSSRRATPTGSGTGSSRSPSCSATVARSGVTIVDRPAYEWRGLHVDVARQFFPAADVERIIDLAAWRKLDRLHLHLTDDEAWRVPIDGLPRAHHGRRLARSRPRRSRRCSARRPRRPVARYTVDEIRGWVAARCASSASCSCPRSMFPATVTPRSRRSRRCAILTTRPGRQRAALRRQRAVPGTAEHDAFRRGRVRPDSPTCSTHRGCTSAATRCAPGAWARSPVAAAYAHAHEGSPGRTRSRPRSSPTSWRRSAASPAATSARGRRRPSTVACSRATGTSWRGSRPLTPCALAEAGLRRGDQRARRVLPRHGASTTTGTSPGASWAGTRRRSRTSVRSNPAPAGRRQPGTICSASRPACGSEHIRSAAAFDELVFPRLDAIAERAWTGRIEGGAAIRAPPGGIAAPSRRLTVLPAS